MIKLTCDCGHVVEGEDKFKAEAKMWKHAIHDHPDMLKSMTEEQLESVIKKLDAEAAKQA